MKFAYVKYYIANKMSLLIIIALQAICDWFSFSSCVDYIINNELAMEGSCII